MTEEKQNCLPDGEEDPDESQIDHPQICNNDADICKNLFEEFDVPAKQKTSSDSSGREYMKVYLRVRPFSDEEIERSENQQCVEKESCTTILMHAPKESFAFKNSTRAGGEISHRFSFTNVFDEETTQKSFFDETTLPLVTDFIHGQNCLVFTYGVTNSGKTYTIQGSPKDGGILPRSLDVLFNSIEGKHYQRMNLKPRFCIDVTRLTDEEEHRENNYKSTLLSSLDKETFDLNALLKLDQDSTAELSKASCVDESALHNTIRSQDGREHEEPSIDLDENISRVADDTTINVDAQGPVKFSVWVSFAEIYNETIYDLLEPCPPGKGKKRTTLRLGDDTNGNPYIKGLREIYVSNADEAYKILKIGQKNQRIASTKLNQCSSRSHCIFSVKVLRVVDVEDPHIARVSRLSFVDLAGSERYSKTQSKGDRLKEAGNINTSLMTLGKCLEYLRYNQKNPSQPLIIPFRESKLTRLFQGFFCGKGRASMVVNVNMCASMFDETFHVMKFSAIAKKVTTRVSKPVDLPPPPEKARASAPTPRHKPARPSVPWANGALATPAPPDDAPIVEVDEEEEESGATTVEHDSYQQQLVDLVKVLQEKLIEEKRKMQTLEVKIREEVCQEMADQLVSIEKAYGERVKMEVTAVEEKCDRRIELLTQSIKKARKRARIERIEEDDEEWVPSVFLHAEQTKVREKEHLISEQNAKIAELRQEVKQLKESRNEETATSEVVLELQAHLNDANEEATELKQMLEEAGEAFTEKEAEISKLRAALDDQEACIKKQDAALKHLTAELEKVKASPKVETDVDELSRTKGALEATMAKLADATKQLETRDSMMKELVRTLEETREELARERSYVAQAFDNDEEMIRIKDELQKAETQTKELEKHLADKDEAISSLKRVIEDSKATSLEKNSQTEETEKAIAEKITEIAALAEKLKEVKEELHSTKAALVKIKADSSGKDSRLELLRKELKDKVSELEDAVAVGEEMKKQGLEKEAERNFFKEVNSKTATELESLKKALEERDEALARAKREADSTQSTEEFDDGKAKEMTKQANRIKDMEAEIQEKTLELGNAKSESAEKIAELETRLTECKKEIEKLQNGNALTEIEQQLEESTKALDKKNSQVIARNNTIKRLEMSLAEKERLLSDMEKLPKEPNLRAKEELKTLRRRLVQADKEREESRELLTKKEEKLEEAKQDLEKLKNDRDEKSAKFLRELQDARTELAEAKEDTKKKQEQIETLKEKLDSQSLKNACLQTQLENEKRGLLEKEKAFQKAKEEVSKAKEEASKAKEEESKAKSLSASKLDEARMQLASSEEKVQELEDEVFTVNETTSRIQDEMRKYQNDVVPALENKVKALEGELLCSNERVKEVEERLAQESNEARSRLEKRNKEIEQKDKEVNELREAIKTLDQEKFQELDKLWQEMMSMQKTIEERNKTIDEQEQKLREASLKEGKSEEQNKTVAEQLKTELEKSKKQNKTLTDQLESLREKKSSLEERLQLVSSDTEKDKEVISNLQKVLEEQDRTLTEQGQALDERQNEIETLTTELQGWQEKCSLTARELEKKKEEISGVKKQALVASDEKKRLESQMKDISSKQESTEQNASVRLKQMEEEIRKLKQDRSCFEAQLEKKDEEIRKAHDSRENMVKTMRETFEVAKANKAEYEIKLATVREQCRQELKREMDEELRRTKRDFQRQLNEKDKSLEEIKNEKEYVEKALAAEKAETSKADSSASDPEATGTTDARSNQKKHLKRSSSEMTLAEVKKQLSASKTRKTGDSNEESSPGSVRKTRSRASAKKSQRSSSCKLKRTTPATKVDILPSMEETESSKAGDVTKKRKLFKDLQENVNAADESPNKECAQPGEGRENIPPTSQSTTKKKRKLFQKPSSVASLLSPATLTGNQDAKTEQDSTRNIVARQLRPRAIKYN